MIKLSKADRETQKLCRFGLCKMFGNLVEYQSRHRWRLHQDLVFAVWNDFECATVPIAHTRMNGRYIDNAFVAAKEGDTG